ncbi:MAG: leucine-rich repeat domain-containing protein [Candidatus Hermodarchaeota archaeon]
MTEKTNFSLHMKDQQVLTELEKNLDKSLSLLSEITHETKKIGIQVKNNSPNGEDSRITGLSLINCNLTEVPASIFKLEALQTLNLRENNFMEISSVLQNLRNHKFLKNVFIDPPITLSKRDQQALANLEEQLGKKLFILFELVHEAKEPGVQVEKNRVVGLSLANSNLTSLSESLILNLLNLSALKTLNLRGNKLFDLPLAQEDPKKRFKNAVVSYLSHRSFNVRQIKRSTIRLGHKDLTDHKNLKKIFINPPETLHKDDVQSLIELENELATPLPPISECIHEAIKPGIQIEENRIVGLNLGNCALTNLPITIITMLFKLENLQVLNLRQNRLSDIPLIRKNLSKHKNLKYIFTDPSELLKRRDQKVIVNIENELAISLPVISISVQKSKKPCIQVEKKRVVGLSLANCALTALSETLGRNISNLSALRTLNLRENKLDIPLIRENLINHKKLKYLFTDPQETVLKREKEVLVELENELATPLPLLQESIHETIKPGIQIENKQIIRLSLANCGLTDVSKNLITILAKLEELQIINLRHNKLSDISLTRENLTRLEPLKYLFTDPPVILRKRTQKIISELENDLTIPLPLLPEDIHKTIKPGILVRKKQIIGLSLANSTLSDVIPESIVANILNFRKTLQILNLRENKITNLPADFKRLKNLEYVYLTGNPLEFPPKESYRVTEEDGRQFLEFHLDHVFTRIFIPQKAHKAIIQLERGEELKNEVQSLITSILDLSNTLTETMPNDFYNQYEQFPKNTLTKTLILYQTDHQPITRARVVRQLRDITTDIINLSILAPFHPEIQKMVDEETYFPIKETLQETLKRTSAYRYRALKLPKSFTSKDIPKITQSLLERLDKGIKNDDPPSEKEMESLYYTIILLQSLKNYFSEEEHTYVCSQLLKLRFHQHIRKVAFVREVAENTLATLVPPLEETLDSPLIAEIRAIDEIERIIGIPLDLIEKIDESSIIQANLQIENAHITEVKINRASMPKIPENIDNLTQLTHLDLGENELKSLPESLGNLSNLRVLDLHDNQLEALPDSFGKLTKLAQLDLETNQLSSIPDSFGNLKALEHLNLIDNQLNSLTESFGNLSKLVYLSLDSNQLSSLSESFGNLTALEQLSLRDNELNSLPKSIGNLSKLRELKLQFNQLHTLPDTIGNLNNLQILNLRSNQLNVLPNSLGKISELLYLDAEGNQLTALPETIGKLLNLRQLFLESNQLRTLPSSIGDLRALSKLDMANNQLRVLPESFGNLSDLHTLNLYRNQLTALPESFGQLSRLVKLNLSWNQLISLPESFGNLKELESLWLQANKLDSLPESFGNLRNLKELDLYDNYLRSLPESFGELSQLVTCNLRVNQLHLLPESFYGLPKLQILSLSNNQFKYLAETIGRLQSLQQLELQFNQLGSLPGAFGNLRQLVELKLYGNRLRSLPESFGKLKNLRELDLYDNQLRALPNSFGKLQNLQQLELQGNQLENLPSNFRNLKNLRELHLYRNLFETRPKILELLKEQGCEVHVDSPPPDPDINSINVT